MSTPLRCVLMGEESLLVRCADLLRQRDHVVVAVITASDAIGAWAREHDVSCIHSNDYVDAVNDVAFDYFFSIANLHIVPESVLKRARLGAINFHDGLLPDRAGVNVPVWTLLRGDVRHGVTWHEMTAGVDEGAILKQRVFDVDPRETSVTLNTKCYDAGAASFAELVDELANGTVQRVPQDPSRRTYFGRFDRPERLGLIDWADDAAQVDALIRALDFGPYANPMTTAKARLGSETVRIVALDVLDAVSTHAPGTVICVEADRVVVATGTCDVALLGLATLDGTSLDLAETMRRNGVSVGATLPRPTEVDAERIAALQSDVLRAELFWRRALRDARPASVPYLAPADAVARELRQDTMGRIGEDGAFGEATPADVTAALFLAYLVRLGGGGRFAVGARDAVVDARIDGVDDLFASRRPLNVDVDPAAPSHGVVASLVDAIQTARQKTTFARDLVGRTPELSTRSLPATVDVVWTDDPESVTLPDGVALAVAVSPEGRATWTYDAAALASDDAARMQAQFVRFANSVLEDDGLDMPLHAQPLASADERVWLLHTLNATQRDYNATPIHRQIETQARTTPDDVALAFDGVTWTYAELDARANRIAHRLVRCGVAPGDRVGVCVDRSAEMVATLIAIWKAGAAYVPLDPAYPADRIAFMIDDAALALVVIETDHAALASGAGGRVLSLDTDRDAIDALPSDAPDVPSDDVDALAYVIYTSGSTGAPKGVMVSHRNVANFFAGMDDRIVRSDDRRDVWLSVTSISFDISVLELFWTLSRGVELVLQPSERDRVADATEHAATPTTVTRPVDFSLFYFSSDEKLDATGVSADKYRLLLEGAAYGDRHGYDAVWTPERHFHDFGGLYPNPSVISAAIAARTERIGIRAGSCVSPLHHPVRIAEDWAVVDNLSRGRVGISFAAGWQPNDFVIQPQNFADRKALMFEQIEQVRALWRGDALTFDGPTGEPVEVQTLPRPVQPDLPVWVTAANNPETFRQAGDGGYFLLTHLLGQSVDDLADKIEVYRRAWREAGHDGEGRVTLMLHTFVGDDEAAVRETVREPMKGYLKSSIGLIQKAAWSFPTFKQKTTDASGGFSLDGLTDDEMDAVLEHAFQRYYETSGLFGTPDACVRRVAELTSVGVDEIACLLDFGVDAQTALDALPALTVVKDRVQRQAQAHAATQSGDGVANKAPDVRPSRPERDVADATSARDASVAAQIRRYDVTHLQCTPSQARMLVADRDTRDALATLRHLMIGGEAFPPALAETLRDLVPGRVTNMYGPTETTIWSSTHDVDAFDDSVPLGRPIANTSIYLLDANGLPVPTGVPGELWIGGDGVTQGYLNRPDLTGERFVDDPFRSDLFGGFGRMYRTGDLARRRGDGTLEFLGRNDFQVKIRGHRIELGEIEAAMERQAGVQTAVVVLRDADDGANQRLVGYVQTHAGTSVDVDALRAALADALPAIMVPSAFVSLDAFPLTPNGKVDRNALPDATPTRAAQNAYVAPENDVQKTVSKIWSDALGVEQVGLEDNFFDLGGHSLLGVQVVRQISERLHRDVPIVELFQYPTVRALAAHLDADASANAESGAQRGQSRAEQRRQALLQRRR